MGMHACGSSEAEIAQKAAKARERHANSGSAPDGMAVFRKNCVTCHGADGTLGMYSAKNLQESTLSLEERVNIITNGKNMMTPFGTLLSNDEIQAVAAYTLTIGKK
jgi:mono/diheme cytochrome c family protein